MLICGTIFIIGTFMGQVLYFPMMVAGSTVYAIGIGSLNPPMQRWIQEYLPEKYIGPVFALTQIIVQFAVLGGTFSVLILPKDEDTAALEANWTWRILTLA